MVDRLRMCVLRAIERGDAGMAAWLQPPAPSDVSAAAQSPPTEVNDMVLTELARECGSIICDDYLRTLQQCDSVLRAAVEGSAANAAAPGAQQGSSGAGASVQSAVAEGEAGASSSAAPRSPEAEARETLEVHHQALCAVVAHLHACSEVC